MDRRSIHSVEHTREDWTEIWCGLIKAAKAVDDEDTADRMDSYADSIKESVGLDFFDLMDLQESRYK